MTMRYVNRVTRQSDIDFIAQKLLNRQIAFATPENAISDFSNKDAHLYALFDKTTDKPLAICTVIPEPEYKYKAIKRLVILDTANCGKGYAKELLASVIKREHGTLGCTPWITNTHMHGMLRHFGFTYQYTFNNIWTFWTLKK